MSPVSAKTPESNATPLPAGRTGLPFLGETRAFLADGFGFCSERVARHGPVWKTRILGRETVVISGPEATAAFNDEDRVLRSGAMVPHVAELMGEISLPLLDGDEHRKRKAFVLAGFTPEAHATYLPTIEREVARTIASWVERGEVLAVSETKKLALETICACFLGINRGPMLNAFAADYDIVLAGFSAFPLPLPGTAYTRAKAALARILARFREVISHERSKGEAGAASGLARILAARAADGAGIGDAELAVELHHIVVAGLIVWADLAALLLELDRHPAVRAKLEAEIAAAAPAAIDAGALRRLPYLHQVVLEVKRVAPIVPVFFGRARRDFDLEGRRISQGRMVLWSHRTSLLSPTIFPEPEKFDPDRFSPERAEHLRHPFGYAPQGAGPANGHKCPGIDFATLLMSAFAIEISRSTSWRIPNGQDLTYDWSKIPPEPKSGLRLAVEARHAMNR